MSTRILLLRGINVGGSGQLPMKELVGLLESLGLRNVQTYIQSGNAVFDDPEDRDSGLAEVITSAIEDQHGFRPHSLLLSANHLHQAAESNPFPEAESNPKSVHLFFLSAPPDVPDVDALTAAKSPSERFQLTDKVFYLYAPDGVGRSKLAAKAEKILGVPTTARNWRTVAKLLEMAQSN